MPLLFDDDLLFEDSNGRRPAVVINRWACELPTNGVPAPKSWPYYVRTIREWLEFISERGVSLFDTRTRLKAVLGSYSVYRARGPIKHRFAASTWNQNIGILAGFYKWAVGEGLAEAEPFTYRQGVSTFAGHMRKGLVNQARRRQAKPHVTIKYLDEGFSDLFLKGLAGLDPDGERDLAYRGRELTRSAAVGRMVLSSGLRSQEFTYLLVSEVPALPSRRSAVPVSFPVPEGVTKGSKFRETWIDYDALAELWSYIELDRVAATMGSSWRPPARWGEPLIVSEAGHLGGRVNGRRVRWAALGPAERRRLVAPNGGSMLLSVWGTGAPFTAWSTVFARTADRIRERYEPRFPHVAPHRLRHSMAMQTMARLVRGYYEQAARQVRDTGDDAALAHYLRTTEPLLILRDLLGHESSVTTEAYLHRLDVLRLFESLYQRVGEEYGLLDDEASSQLAAEFASELELV
ncbi:site-specific integrase [Streptomyces sp. AP-93]|uniref:site-specific integrase n=1 Tax=Streptomyces sp. AP-93 TaxID=2929048 RepID=UPI001FAE87BD|nr:site-specific integrase [Streptomyces sp. AP-93]MCJ0869587.1 site-specific integrase [Streptomyces sp. AP-93]